MVYVHVSLGAKEYGLFRVGGYGLANCMFFVTRGIILAHRHHWQLLRPTWERFGVGPILRHEKDKRFYIGMFRNWLSWETVKKICCLLWCSRITIENAEAGETGIVTLLGWWNYFSEMPSYWPIVKEYFDLTFSTEAIRSVPQSFHRTIAVHVRMGDMPNESRVPIEWTCRMLQLALDVVKEARVLLFSDATDDEVSALLQMAVVKRVYYGNALADMVAMSRTQMIIGTCSTFSWWSAYLTQIPIVQPKQNSGCCHRDATKFCVMDCEVDYPESFKKHIREVFS